MSGRGRRATVAIFVALFAWSTLSLAGVSVAFDPFAPPSTTVVAEFPQTVGLYPKDEVRVDGIIAGHVQRVEPRIDSVRVTMTIHDVALAPDAKAVLRLASLIGQRYVELGPLWSGHGERLHGGAVIPKERTEVPAEIADVLDQFGRVVKGIDKDALAKMVHELAIAVDGGRDTLGQLVGGLADTSQALAAHAGEIDASLARLQDVVATLANRDDKIVDILRSSSVVSDALLAQDGALDTAVKRIDGLLGQVSQLTVDQKEKLVALVGHLDEVGKVLAAHEGDFQRVVDQLPYFSYGYARAIDHDGDRWYTINGPMGILFLPPGPAINSKGGPGTDSADGRLVPRIDNSKSPAAGFVPSDLDASAGMTKPLLPAESFGVPGAHVSHDPGGGG